MKRAARDVSAEQGRLANGTAMAAFLAAAIGAFATGCIVVLNEMGLLVVPELYAPAGGVSSRTTIAVVIWLIVWAVLHARWRGRELDPVRVALATLLLLVLGILGTFPPLWKLL